MASNTPSPGTPNPDDQSPSKKPHQRENLLSDWQGAEEIGPASGAAEQIPDPITEQILFDDLIPRTPKPVLPDDAIPTADPIPSTSPVDPEDAITDLPLTKPGSGWADSPSGSGSGVGSELFDASGIFDDSDSSIGTSRMPKSSLFEMTNPPSGEDEAAGSGSDLLSTPSQEGSDILRGTAQPDSGIFGHGTDVSDQSETPANAPESLPEFETLDPSREWSSSELQRPASELFDDNPDLRSPASELFDDNPELRSPASELFDEIPNDDSKKPGSEFFEELVPEEVLLEPDTETDRAGQGGQIQFEDSGVDLLNPAADQSGEGASAAGGGSIFDIDPSEMQGSAQDSSALQLPDDELGENIHLPTGEVGPRSDLFRGPDSGVERHEQVSFDLPEGSSADASQQASGMIDWTTPAEGAGQESSDLTAAEAAAAAEALPPVGPTRRPRSSVPDLNMAERTRPTSRPGLQRETLGAKQRSSGRVAWLVGPALGVLIGAGGFTGAYLSGLLPSRSDTPVGPAASSTPRTPPPSAPIPGAPRALLLAAGDPAAALKAYEAAGEVTSPEDRAGRGQARWLTRLRELATRGETPKADDPQLQQAVADLQAVVQNADALETAEQKRAGVLAALHLGLIQELTGNVEAATTQYKEAITKFPTHKRVFDAALDRITMATKLPPAKSAKLTPAEFQELAQLTLIATVLLQAPENATDADDEPGFYFWEACQLNAGRQYLKAADLILKVRAIHEQRRLKLAGRGLNPLSDPFEQMFTRACTEIREYWVLKHHFYGHKELGEELRSFAVKGKFPDFLDEVVALRKASASGDSKKLARVQTALDKATAELSAATTKAATEMAAVMKEKETIARDLTETKQSLDEQTKQLTDAKKSLGDALARQKKADDTLATVVKELKANKLLDDKDDIAAALAKLPEVMRKASTAATSADARKAAAALQQAKADLDKTEAELKLAQTNAARLEKLAQTAAADVKAAEARTAEAMKQAAANTKGAEAKTAAAVKQATETATARARKQLEVAAAQLAAVRDEIARKQQERTAALKRAEAQFATKLAEQQEEHRRQLANVRAGVVTPLTTAEVAARERAAHSYDAGVRLFFSSRFAEAEAMLTRATNDDATDARYWYYLGLAQAGQGKPTYADSLTKGAEQEAHGQPGAGAVNAAVERLPGSYRQILARYRP